MTKRPTCETCPYFHMEDDGISFGQCRRHPPQIMSHDMFADPDGELEDDAAPHARFAMMTINATQYPRVSGYEDWCGEHPEFDASQKSSETPAQTKTDDVMDRIRLARIKDRAIEDWMDCNDIPRKPAARSLMRSIADLYEDGLNFAEMTKHRRVRRKSAYASHSKTFYLKWVNRKQEVEGYIRRR